MWVMERARGRREGTGLAILAVGEVHCPFFLDCVSRDGKCAAFVVFVVG